MAHHTHRYRTSFAIANGARIDFFPHVLVIDNAKEKTMRLQNRTGRAKRPKIRRPRRTKPIIRCPRSLAGVSTFVVSYSSQPKVLFVRLSPRRHGAGGSLFLAWYI